MVRKQKPKLSTTELSSPTNLNLRPPTTAYLIKKCTFPKKEVPQQLLRQLKQGIQTTIK